MKKFTILLLLMLILASANVFAQNAGSDRQTPQDGFITDNPNELRDIAPNAHPGQVQFAVDDYPLLFEYPCGNTTGEAGVETDGNFIYTSLWNGTEFCKYASDGTYLGTFSIPGVAAVRDMAYDGFYFYGAAANTTVFEMDFNSQTLIGTITAPTAIRGLAYDEYEDSFWGNNWSTPIVNFDRTGQTINTIPTVDFESYYGFAFDTENHSLWGYSQKAGTSLNMLYEISLSGGNIINQFDMCTILTLPTPGTDIAGGLYFSKDLINNYGILGGIVQNICLWGIEFYYIGIHEYDVGVNSFISPIPEPGLGEEIVTVRVKNYGSVTQTNIPVSYTLDGGTPVTGIVPGPIAAGQTEDFTFPGTVNLNNPGHTYQFIGCTALEGDENPGNDCKTMNLLYMPTEYCDASTTNEDEFISYVACGNIANSSNWQNGVADYTAISTNVAATWPEEITVMNGNPKANDNVYVWIDWNKDSIFEISSNEEFILNAIQGIGSKFTGAIVAPEGTPPGNYRMRIRMTYLLPPEPCGNADYGEIEDYTVAVFVPEQNDVGVLDIFLPYNGWDLSDEIVTIRIKNFGTVTQNDIPVFYTVDNGNIVTGTIKGPLSGNDVFDYTFTGFADLGIPGHTYIVTACTNLEEDEANENNCYTATTINVTPFYVDGSTNTEDEYIANVLFGSINNSSGWQGNTADYTDQFTIIPTGESEAITVTNGNAWASDIVYVWVDWNKDYSFEWWGGPEEYHLTNLGGTGEIFTGEIIVPEGQAGGNYRMRVRMSYSSPPIPGGNASYGEVEDYTIVIDAETPAQVRANPATISQILEPGESAVQTVILSNVGELPLTFEISVNTGNNVMKSSFSDNPNQLTDVGVVAILSPVTGINIADEIVTITIKNFGNALQSNIPVAFTVNDHDTISDIVPGTLVSGASVDFTFPGMVNLGISGQVYVIKAFTTLSGDENPDNNCETAFVNNLFTEFCEALTTKEDEFISNVLVGNINNSSDWQDSIAGFTNLSTTIEAGASENIMVTNGLPYTNDLVTAWVDWNKDFDFNAADEHYVLTNQNGAGETFTGEISVPQNQPTGNYRLRIRMCYYTEPVPCGGSTYGEIEEYSIHVVNNQTITWLAVEPMTGVVNPNDSTTINVTFDATGMQNGWYEGSIIISSNDPCDPFTTIPVTLIVGQCPLPMPLNPEGYEILPNIAYISWQAPEIPGNLLGYNIYRNNQKINPNIVSNLFYEDSLTNPSQYFYHITAVYPECEASSDTISLVITNLLAKENDGITIFPNPATNSVNIKSQHSIIQISILNNLGQVVFSGNSDSNSVQVNTSGFNKGIYMIQVKTVEGSLVKKLVIQ